MSLTVSGQLGLGLQLREDASFANFQASHSGNRLLVDTLQAQLNAASHPLVFLHGANGSGRSHLLQASCLACRATSGSSILLPLSELAAHAPNAVLNGLETLDLIALDDLDAVCGQTDWEEALFHAFNRWRDRGCHVLISALLPPAQLPVRLPDLASRLSAATVFQVHALDDDDKITWLRDRAHARGLQMDADTARFLMHRLSRDTAQLLDWLNRLDQAALVQQRRLTIPFVRSVLNAQDV